jgi:tetratricopeptide (TPR) repeat protein
VFRTLVLLASSMTAFAPPNGDMQAISRPWVQLVDALSTQTLVPATPSDCDLLAASPFDPNRPPELSGVELARIDYDKAIPICRAVLTAHPNEARILFELGRALEQSGRIKEAVAEYKKAVDLGYSAAIINLGQLYVNGKGVEKNEVEAARLFRKAADAGNPLGMRFIGFAYAKGIGVEKDPNQAAKWLQASVQAGDVESMLHLGELYGESNNYSAAIPWFLKSAEAGNLEAKNDLGVVYNNGYGVERNEVEAVRRFRDAADGGNSHGMVNLALAYASGLGITKDEDEARGWLNKAAGGGSELAKYYLYVLGEAPEKPLPSTEEFMGIISACATSNKVEIGGALRGSIRSFYDGQRTVGDLIFQQSSNFLNLFPENQREEAYKIYTGCVKQLVHAKGAPVGLVASDVKLIRERRSFGPNGDDTGPFYTDFISLSLDAWSRRDESSDNSDLSRNYYVEFSIMCKQTRLQKIVGNTNYAFSYSPLTFDAGPILISMANTMPDGYIDEALKNDSNTIAFIRNNHVIAASRIEDDTVDKFQEISDDLGEAFGKGLCSVENIKIQKYYLVTIVGIDGFDQKNYFKLSTSIDDIRDGVPHVKALFEHSDEESFNSAAKGRVSFAYSRLVAETGDDGKFSSKFGSKFGSKFLLRQGSSQGQAIIEKYKNGFVQPTVEFFIKLGKGNISK